VAEGPPGQGPPFFWPPRPDRRPWQEGRGMRSDLLGAAYHKGAHAVVGRSVGWVVVSIDISAGGDAEHGTHRKSDPPFR
jgi:hypothetical protein